MTPFLYCLLAVALVAFSIWGTLDGRKRIKRVLDASFDAQRFPTPAGTVTGESIQVVKIVRDTMPFAYDDVWQLGTDPLATTSFWYCVGPGPSYFLALPMLTTRFGGASVKWVVRSLSADRMRAVLQGDDEALRAAFGDPGIENGRAT